MDTKDLSSNSSEMNIKQNASAHWSINNSLVSDTNLSNVLSMAVTEIQTKRNKKSKKYGRPRLKFKEDLSHSLRFEDLLPKSRSSAKQS